MQALHVLAISAKTKLLDGVFHFGYRNKCLGEKDDTYNLLAHQHKHTLLFPFIDHFLITT